MGLTCAKAAVKTQAPLEENEDAQDRSDELLERWRSGELAHLQRVYRSHARPPQNLDRDGLIAALELEDHAHANELFELFGNGSCRDFCRTLSWWCRGDASERRSFLFCWFCISSTADKDALVAGDASSAELPKNMLGALCALLEAPPPYHLCAKNTITWRKFDVWARTLSDEQVWAALPLAIVSQPDTEREMVLETWHEGTPGDVYHVIPRRWWDAWCAYVGWSNLAPPPPGARLTVTPAGASCGRRPRDVDASRLESDKDGSLRAKIDVACVPEAVRRLFETWYGGGPLFPRRLQEDGMLDLYPVSVFIDECDATGRPRNAFCAQRADRKESIAAFAKRLSGSNSRMYAQSPTGWRRLTPSSRCDEVLEAGATYLLESKIDGAWPRASSRYVVGDRVSARDHTERWRSGKVIAVSEAKGVKVRFDEYSSKWDEWLSTDRLKREDVDIDDVSLSEEDEERPSLLKGAVSSLRRVLGSNDEEEEEVRKLPATGLANLGNTCFLNAAVQCLSHAPILRAYCLSDMYVQDINRTSRLGSQGRVVEAFSDLLRQLHASSVCVRPEAFKKVLGKCKPQFSGSEQQDSQEFLNELLDVLHEDVNLIQEKPYVPEPDDADEARDGLVAAARDALRRSRMRDKSLISDLFQGQLVAKKSCKVCARSSVKFEPFTSLSLPVPAPASRSFVVAVLRLAKHANGRPSLTVRVEAPRLGDVRDLKSAVAAQVNLDGADNLTLCDVARHRIYRVLDEDTLPLGALGDFPQVTDASKRLLIAYERPQLELAKTPSVDFPASFEELAVGQRLDALDHKRQWYVGTIVDDTEPCRDKNHGKPGYIRVRFDRFSAKWDECFCRDDWPAKLQPPYSKSKGNRLAAFEICVVHRTPKKGLFGTPFVARVASDRSCRALKRAVLRQASLYNHEGSISVISRDSLSDADIDLDSSDSCRCLSDRFFIALNWDSSSTYREPLSLQKLPPVPTSPRHYDLASCLQSFSREETLSKTDSWRCPRCKKSVEATSSIGLWSTPDVLVIHLKRFLCTARWREKLRTDIRFPRRGLDLSKFLPAEAYAVYDLFGVINHLGSLSGGHYTSHVKVSPCSSDGVEEASVAFEESERWLHIDDDLVEPAKPEDVVTDGAYVLFYRRRRLSGRLVVGHTAVGPVAAGV